MKYLLILIFLIFNAFTSAAWEASNLLPPNLVELVNYIDRNESNENGSLKRELEAMNLILNKFDQWDSKIDVNVELNLRINYRKWFLLNANKLTDKNTSTPYHVIDKLNMILNDSYLDMFIKNIKEDLEQIKLKNPKQKDKVNPNDLSSTERRQLELILPWANFILSAKSKELLYLNFKPHIENLLAYLNHHLRILSLLTEETKVKHNYAYIKKVKVKKPTETVLPANFPKPVDDWNEKKVKGKKLHMLDENGLPLPVNDWILDF